MKLIILSEGDSAGSGSRISAAINKYSNNIQSKCIVNRSKRKIGHFNPDYIISEMEDNLPFLQEMINQADVIHFKDDEPLSRDWNGLKIPQNKPIVHTAGGSSFRGHEFTLDKLEHMGTQEIIFNKSWKTQKRINGRFIHTNDKEIQIDGFNFKSKNHNNIWSKRIVIPGKINSLVIKGKHRLIERREKKNYDIRALIVRYFDDEGKIIETKKKNVGSLKSMWTDFESIFPVPEGALSMRFSFFNHRIYQINYLIRECSIEFYKLNEDKLVSLNSQTNVANSTWDLEAYSIADMKTVLTPDLLFREENRIITPHVQPDIRIRKKRKKEDEGVIITHAPSNTGKKGTNEFIIPAINELSKKYNIKFNLIQNLSHKDCLQEISKSDIFIDQMVAGYYGNAGLEAMTMGIPVLAYVNDETLRLAGSEWSDIPLLRVNKLSKESIKKTLEPYLKNNKKLIEISNLNKKWVKKTHSPKKIASMWEKIYTELIKNRDRNFKNRSKNNFIEIQNDYSENLFRGGGSWREGKDNQLGIYKLSVNVDSLKKGEEKINIYIDRKLSKRKEIKLSFFRIGWYRGKGARLIHSERVVMENLIPENDYLVKYVIYPDVGWPSGCYRIIIEDENMFKGRMHFFFDNHENDINTNLLVYPHIGSAIWNKKNNQFLDYFYSKRNENIKIESIDISEDNRDEGKIIEWLFPTITWLERNKIPFRLIRDIDIKENLEYLEKIKTIIFIGDNHIWTQEIHNMVKTHLGKNIGDLVIFGSGVGEEIAYLTEDNKEALISSNFHSVNNFEKWSGYDLPISIGSNIPRKRLFEENIPESGERLGLEIDSIVDKYDNNIRFSEKLLSIDGEEYGEISSRIFHLANGSKIFNGGMMNFPKYLPEIDKNSEIKVFKEIHKVLKSMMWSEGKIYSDAEMILDKFNKNWTEEDFKFENKKVPKICLIMPIWKRQNLTEKIMRYYQKMKLSLEGEIELINIAVGSEGEKSKKLSEKYHFDYIEHENFPLSKKWDRGIKESKKFNPDAVLIIGSDDVIEPKLIHSLLNKLNEGRLVVGIMDLYIYDTQNKILNHWNGYSKNNHRYGETIGLCRLISKNLLEKMNYSIWRNLEIDKGLDLAMTNRFIEFGIFPKHHLEESLTRIGDKIISISHTGYFLEEIEGIAIDIKGELNITSLESYELETQEKPELISKLNLIIGD